MDEILSIAQIDAQFQSEWVLIDEPQTNEALEVQGGKVRWHSKDREEVYRKVPEAHPRRFAIVYGTRGAGVNWAHLIRARCPCI